MKNGPFQLRQQTARLARYRAGAVDTLARLAQQNFSQRLWQRDGSLWSSDAAVQAKIRNRLGWLTSPDNFQPHCTRIRQFVRGLQQEGFTHAIVLGMGGSSMCPEVCRTTFGVARGHLDLQVVDTTDPATIRAREQAVDLRRTLIIVSTKSGTTSETVSLYKYFYDRMRALKGEAAGQNFVVITDAGTSLAQQASERKFRDCFLNPVDIGGRFSALSFFGLVPAAAIGVDVSTFLSRAQQMARACGPDGSIDENPGVVLGAILAYLYTQGRDKLTFVLDPAIASFGYWVEQLVAESLGKIGKGIVPIEGEPLASPRAYGRDRVFARLALGFGRDKHAGKLRLLERAGHPIIQITLRDKLDLAAELYRWEIATATAGALMQLNPFDEPNVQESKDITDRLLAEFRTSGRLPDETPTLTHGRLRVTVATALEKKVAPRSRLTPMAELFGNFLRLARAGDYLGLNAYVQATKEHQRLLQVIRVRLRDRLRCPVTVGYGPRFQHSTGQLHKGGPNNGLYFQLVATNTVDLPVPGEPYTFGILKQAQALGDFAALTNKARRVLRVHVGEKIGAGLGELTRVLNRAVARARRPQPRAAGSRTRSRKSARRR